MSKNENKGEKPDNNESENYCKKSCNNHEEYMWNANGILLQKGGCKIKNLERELEGNKSLLKYYEDEDSKNILTNNGRDILYRAKRVAIYVFFGLLALTVLSIKKTLDNIEARVHNASSVTTK